MLPLFSSYIELSALSPLGFYVPNVLCGGPVGYVLPSLSRGEDSLLYGPNCHGLMKCLLTVAMPGHIQLNHNALVYEFTLDQLLYT